MTNPTSADIEAFAKRQVGLVPNAAGDGYEVAVQIKSGATGGGGGGTGDASAANQATQIASLGAPADAVYGGSGNTTIIGALKGIFAQIVAGVGLKAGTNVIGKVGVQVAGADVASGNPVPVSVVGATTDASTATLQTSLNTSVGVGADAAYGGSGSTTLMGALKGIYTKLSTIGLAAGTKVGLQVAGADVAAGNPVSVNIVNDAAGAATAANQSTQIASLGAVGDAAYAGSGSSSIIAALKGIYTKLGGVVLAAGTAVIGKVGLQVGGSDVAAGNPIPVSVTADSVSGTGADAAYAGSGSATLVSALKGIYAKLDAMATDATAAVVNLTQINGSAISSTNALPVKQGAATPWRYAALSNTPQSVAGGNTALLISSYYLENPDTGTAKLYIHFYDKATAPTVGTDTPVWSLALDATDKANVAGLHLNFALGCWVAASTTATGSTAPTTAAVVNLGYRAP